MGERGRADDERTAAALVSTETPASQMSARNTLWNALEGEGRFPCMGCDKRFNSCQAGASAAAVTEPIQTPKPAASHHPAHRHSISTNGATTRSSLAIAATSLPGKSTPATTSQPSAVTAEPEPEPDPDPKP